MHERQISGIRRALFDENSVWSGFVESLFRDVDIGSIKKLVKSFLINANLETDAKSPLLGGRL
jgi:hypothetical protein